MFSVCGYWFTKNVSYEIVCLLDVLLSCKNNDKEFQKRMSSRSIPRDLNKGTCLG